MPTRTDLHAILILAVTTVLLVVLLNHNISVAIALSAMIVLVIQIMVLGDAKQYLVAVLELLGKIFKQRIP
jgi:hypothetical protein